MNSLYVCERGESRFFKGEHTSLYQNLGAHVHTANNVEGVHFAVWAPHATAVSVVGDFNHWDGQAHRMRQLDNSGIWHIFVPALTTGDVYKYQIWPQEGPCFLKSDPFAFYTETAPATASIVYDLNRYHWNDGAWIKLRSHYTPWLKPVSIYEVHLASWMKNENSSQLSYREIARYLIPYVKSMGFTHIEMMPIAEHPYEPSWGYQVSNFYAPNSRLGKPDDLMAFIDQCHHYDIGVILDWVPGHFPKDSHGLAEFDGTFLFEPSDPAKREQEEWGTLIFDYRCKAVVSFLISNALFWLEYYHFDGLRVDAVSSMLYLNDAKHYGKWTPNEPGDNHNVEAVEFLKNLNTAVHGAFPGVMMIAEESSAWPGVSQPVDRGGLGFGFKWNMGWMHDVLDYMQTPPECRPNHHDQLVNVFAYAFNENFVLSLSHDEVVHLKRSLLQKMPGGEREKFANLRLLLLFMYCHPGKKLNFMGAEFAQIDEWCESRELQWHLVEKQPHRLLNLFFKTLNHLYRNEKALHQKDCRPVGFEWIDAGNREQSIIVFMRKASEPRNALIIILNFSAVSRIFQRVGVPFPVTYTEILNSNDEAFGGDDACAGHRKFHICDMPWNGQEFSLVLHLPALSGIVLKPAAPEGVWQ